MALLASKSGGSFEPMPVGVHQLVCVDVNDEGLHENPYNEGQAQEKISITWQSVAPLREDGSRFIVSKWFTNSLHEKASLAKLVMDWLGVDYNDIPEPFDIESLIGRNARARIRHVQKKNGTGVRAEIQSIEPWEGPEDVPVGYIRKIDRPDYVPPSKEVQAASFHADSNGAAPAAHPQSTPVAAAAARTPDALLGQIISEGVATFGDAFPKEVNKLATKVAKGKSYTQLTEAQAGEVLQQLRAVSPAKAVKAKTAHVAAELDDDEDPFGDDDPGSISTTEASGQVSAFATPVTNTAHA